jgi:hypothetical protein
LFVSFFVESFKDEEWIHLAVYGLVIETWNCNRRIIPL